MMKLVWISLLGLLLLDGATCSHLYKRKGGEEGKSGSGDKSDMDEWLEMFEKECGPKMDQLDKPTEVTVPEVIDVLNREAQVKEKLASALSMLDNYLEGQDLKQFMVDLKMREKFGRAIEGAIKEEMCGFVSMQMLLDRLTYIGGSGFVESQCAQTYQMLNRMDKPRNWLQRVQKLVKDDLKCIIRGLRGYKAYFRNLTRTEAVSIRAINMGLASAMANEALLMDDINYLDYAINQIEELQPAAVQPSVQPSEAPPRRNGRRNLVRLMKALLDRD
jgi:HPt (histidine-containing phosphotransfer) domain-containing protein